MTEAVDPVAERIARRVERHLADVANEGADAARQNEIAEECWTLCTEEVFEYGFTGKYAETLAKKACIILGYPRP